MERFPDSIKPVTSQGYSFGTPENIVAIETLGGASIQVRDFKYAPVLFNIVFVGDRVIRSVITDFFYGRINAGADKFTMVLDSGNGLEDHTVVILPNTMNFDGSGDPRWIITCQMLAERTPSQDADGSLSTVYGVYGDGSEEFIDAIADLVLVQMI